MALDVVRPGGTVSLAGIHMSDIPSFEYRRLWQERTVRSVANMTRRGRARVPRARGRGARARRRPRSIRSPRRTRRWPRSRRTPCVVPRCCRYASSANPPAQAPSAPGRQLHPATARERATRLAVAASGPDSERPRVGADLARTIGLRPDPVQDRRGVLTGLELLEVLAGPGPEADLTQRLHDLELVERYLDTVDQQDTREAVAQVGGDRCPAGGSARRAGG